MAETVGIRDLKQNASAVIRRVEAGETVTVTHRGVPVATINPIRRSRLDELEAAGQLRRATKSPRSVPEPLESDVSISEVLRQMREEERY